MARILMERNHNKVKHIDLQDVVRLTEMNLSLHVNGYII